MEATEQLCVKGARPLGDLGRVVAAREHRCRADEEYQGELVADASGLSVVRDLTEPLVEAAVAFDHNCVEVDHVRPLDELSRYLQEQHLSTGRIDPVSLFPPSVLDGDEVRAL